eukprot:3220075-Pleurochrysis_carterae.AAC.1
MATPAPLAGAAGARGADLPAKREDLVEHPVERGRGGAAGVREDRRERARAPLDLWRREGEGHVGRLRVDTQLAEKAHQVRVVAVVAHLRNVARESAVDGKEDGR